MNIDNKFLLVCLQLIIVLVMSMIVEGMPSENLQSESSTNPVQPSPYPCTKPIQRENSTERSWRLFHMCSNKEVVIKNSSRVATSANRKSIYGNLVLETIRTEEDEFRIRIRGSFTGKYLCFNKEGRLKAKPEKRAVGIGKRKERYCEFTEKLSEDGNFLYTSASNDRWVLGFNEKGNPMLGSRYMEAHRKNCFRFHKTPIADNSDNEKCRNRQQPTIEEHNGRVHLLIKQPDLAIGFNNLHVLNPRLRHSKKSQHNRRTHHQRASADR